MNVIVTDRKGIEHRLEAEHGWKLMEVIFHAGLPIKAECGGNCICSTCHVYVDPEWLKNLSERGPDETATLDIAANLRPNSRLSCQIILNDALDGLRVTLAPEEE